MPSYYEILEIDENAGSEQIQAAYDRLAKECYANLRDPKTHDACVEKLKRIAQARDTLLNPELRKKYDERSAEQALEQSAPPSPWRRLFARLFDRLLFIAAIYPLYRYFADYVFYEDWVFALAAVLVGIALYIILETAVITVSGGTPGKWVHSVKITAGDGGKPTRAQLLKRNLMEELFGFGLDIPPVTIVTLILQYRGLKKPENGGLPVWDRACGTAAQYAETVRNRLLLWIPVLIAVLVELINALY